MPTPPAEADLDSFSLLSDVRERMLLPDPVLPTSQSSSNSSDLFPSSPGFTEALATLPIQPSAFSLHPYADALSLSSPLTNPQPTFPSTWKEGKNVFVAANRKRKRSASPEGRIGFGFRNAGQASAAAEKGVGSSQRWRAARATVDDITVTSNRDISSHHEESESKPFVSHPSDDHINPLDPTDLGDLGPDVKSIVPRQPEVDHIQGRGNIGEDGDPSAAYIDSEAYDGSKFGGIGEYLRHRRMKLQIQNKAIALARGGSKPQIFEGLYLYINGYVKPSLETCREMIMAHGGTYIPYLDRKSMITHIIATTLTPSKHLEFAKYKVATPQWLVESAACGKLLDWRDFKLVAGGGVEEGLRGGLGGWMKGTQGAQEGQGMQLDRKGKGIGKGKGKGKEVDWSRNTEETGAMEKHQATGQDSASTSRTNSTPSDMETEELLPTVPAPAVPLPDREPPEPPPPAPQSRIPVRPTAPVFSSLSPSTLRTIVAPSKGQAPPMTTDPTTFEMTVASGCAKYQENQDAKRLMQDNEWRGMHTAVNEGFLEGYYQNSRLHHLSAWKAELKVLVAQAQKESESSEVIQKLAPHASQEDKSLSLATAILPRASPRKEVILDTKAFMGNKVIFHVDFDAFFVSCGLATRPELKGKPVVVCHSQGGDGKKAIGEAASRVVSDRGQSSTSEIASCSYEARACGVKNGMSLGQARRLCPEVQTIPYEFETYKKFSLAFYTILMAYADELQAVSVDEALIDVSNRVEALAQAPPAFEAPSTTMTVGEVAIPGTKRDVQAVARDPSERDWANEMAEMIRSDVRAATGCEVSIGIAANIMLARLATRHAKPAGAFHLTQDRAGDFLQDLDIGELPGFAYSAKKRIESMFGDSTCGALLAKPKGSLQTCLGPKSGETLFNFIRGIDDRKLEPHKERKSVSAEVNRVTAMQYGIRFISVAEAEKFLCDLSEEVGRRLKAVGRKGRMLTLKVMVRHPDAPLEAPKFMGHGVCNVFNKSMAISDGRNGATDDAIDISKGTLTLYRSQDFDATELRGIGIQMQKLEGGTEEIAREAGQKLLHFGRIEAFPDAASVSARDLTPPPVIEEEDVDVEVSQSKVPVLRSKTRRDAKSLTRLAKAEAPPPVPVTAPPMTSRTKFGYKPRVRTLDIPCPNEIDPEMWKLIDETERKDFRTAWKQQGLSIPVALRAGVSGKPEAESKLSIFGKRSVKEERKPTPQAVPRLQQRSLDVKVTSKRARSRTPHVHASSESEADSVPMMKLAPHATSEIEQLGINVDFFRNLPEELAREVYEGEKLKKANEKRLMRKGLPIKLDANGKLDRSPKTNKILKAINAATIVRPKVNQKSDVESVLQMITDWMDTKGGEPPMEGEIKVFRKYLLRCVDPVTGGLGGIEDASRVLAWWRTVCRKRFAQIRESPVSVAWRSAFLQVKADMDEIIVKRFGAALTF